MKKILLIYILLVIVSNSFSQGFLFPVKDNIVDMKRGPINRDIKVTSDSTYNIHLLRFNVEVQGVQIFYNKVTKDISSEAFSKLGIGLSYSFYKVTNNVPYNYLSLNGFLFFPMNQNYETMSIAVTASAYHIFGTNLSPALGIGFEPAKVKSDYFPVGPLINLKYNF